MRSNMRKVEVIEDVVSTLRKLVRSEVRCQKEKPDVSICQISKSLPGVSGEYLTSVTARASRD